MKTHTSHLLLIILVFIFIILVIIGVVLFIRHHKPPPPPPPPPIFPPQDQEIFRLFHIPSNTYLGYCSDNSNLTIGWIQSDLETRLQAYRVPNSDVFGIVPLAATTPTLLEVDTGGQGILLFGNLTDPTQVSTNPLVQFTGQINPDGTVIIASVIQGAYLVNTRMQFNCKQVIGATGTLTTADRLNIERVISNTRV